MKKQTLTILLSLSFLVGKGQVDSLALNYDTTGCIFFNGGVAFDSSYAINFRFPTISYKYDTIPVIMLVCDTSNEYTQLIGCFTEPCEVSRDFRFAYFKYGYSVVREEKGGAFDGYSVRGYWEHIGYIDDKRKPLSKSIIVWQSKTR